MERSGINAAYHPQRIVQRNRQREQSAVRTCGPGRTLNGGARLCLWQTGHWLDQTEESHGFLNFFLFHRFVCLQYLISSDGRVAWLRPAPWSDGSLAGTEKVKSHRSDGRQGKLSKPFNKKYISSSHFFDMGPCASSTLVIASSAVIYLVPERFLGCFCHRYAFIMYWVYCPVILGFSYSSQSIKAMTLAD